MKKSKWIPIVVVIVAVVLVVGIVIATRDNTAAPDITPSSSPTVPGNSPSTPTDDPEISETPSVGQQYTEALDAAMDIPSVEGESDPAFLTEVENRNGYEVLSVEETADGAMVTLLVSAPDLYSVAKQLDAEGAYSNEDELLAAIHDAVINAELVETEITLAFEKTEDGYAPILTSEFLDALYGGVFELCDELLRVD